MDLSGVPTLHMDWNAVNLHDACRKFKQHVQLMYSSPLAGKDEVIQCSHCLLWVGERGRDISHTWTLTADEAKKLMSYYDRFEASLMPKMNTTFARYKFNERLQGKWELLDHFVTDMKLETILGMANYLSRFASDLVEVNAIMRKLLIHGNLFVWD